jgi:tetratricopeptide (TPR) repeat protein
MLEAAHHHMHAGHPTRAVDTLIVGVELALNRGAPQEAARAIERTVASVPSYRRDELGVLLAETQLAQGMHGTAAEVVRELDTVRFGPALRTRAVLVDAEAHQRGQFAPQPELAQQARSALALAQEWGDEGLVLRALQLNAEVAHDAADESTVEKVYHLTSEISASTTRKTILPTASTTLGYCLMVRGRHMEAAHHFADGVEGLRIQRRETELRRALNGLGICLTNTGEVGKASDCFEEALALAKHAGDPFAQSIVWDNLAVINEDTGRFDEAVAARKLAFELAERAATAKRRAEILTNAASLATTLGCKEEAGAYLDIAVRLARASGIPGLAITALVTRADLCIASGDHDSAWSWADEALAIATRHAERWRPIGDFERVRLHFIWATQGHDAYEAARLRRPDPGLSFRLSQQLELRAFQEWVAQQVGVPCERMTAIDELVERGFFGAILRLVRLRICPSGLIPNDPTLTSVARLTRTFPGCLREPLPERVDVPLEGVESLYSA